MNTPNQCPTCGSALQIEDGMCAACLLGFAAENTNIVSDETPEGKQALDETHEVGNRPERSTAESTTNHDKRLTDFLRPCSKPGRLGMLGHYEIVEVIGQGGMGMVIPKEHSKAP